MSRNLKRKIVDVLRKEFPTPKDRIVLREDADDFHLYVVSPKFQALGPREKHELLVSVLFSSLSKDEWRRITLAVPLTPKDAKKYWPPIPELNGR